MHFLGQITGVGFFQKSNARILAQLEIHLPVARVDRDHRRRAVLQQTIGESSGRGANIEANLAPYIDVPMLKRALQLQSAAADILQIFAQQPNRGVRIATWAPALSIFCSLTKTFPARIRACARSREAASPRSTRSLSSLSFKVG